MEPPFTGAMRHNLDAFKKAMENVMEFETFNRKTASRTKEPSITMQRRGTISVNHAAMQLFIDAEKFNDDYPVELLYNSEEKVVALKIADDSNPNPHLLRRQGKSGVFIVSGRLFVKHYEIPVDRARRYRAREYGKGVVGIRLTDNFAEVGRKAKDEEEALQQSLS